MAARVLPFDAAPTAPAVDEDLRAALIAFVDVIQVLILTEPETARAMEQFARAVIAKRKQR